MGAPLVGFVGVLVGVFATSISGWFARRRDEANERRREANEFKVAIRLVGHEIYGCWHTHRLLLEHQQTPLLAGGLRRLSTKEWKANRGVLAQHVDDNTWWGAEAVTNSVDDTRDLLAVLPPGSPLPPEMVEGLASGQAALAGFFEELTGQAVETGGLAGL